MIETEQSDIDDIDHGPFAMVPEEAFNEAEIIADGVRRTFIVGLIGIVVAFLYLFVVPLTLYWLVKYLRLKYKYPILFGWRQFYSGQTIKELKHLAQEDDQLRRLLKLRRALFQIIFLM